ncbi:hypothetical protein VNO77_20639 [Canavalia gladiata]|uniref:Leucine-rich repeat-containing N-terminal plant-type domain-containing protein n=1 Tax=Canavalia gladiata TaxID=3824 RepID=A0AAN9QJJ2_CANGL
MRFLLLLLPFFIPFCFTNLSIVTYAATSHCLGHQQLLLLHMKHSLLFNHSQSEKLVHWNQTGDCCQWNGVSCNKGRVIGLDLSEEFISGGLDNSSLFNLQYLQNLNLARNDFGSMIPSKFGLLKNLRYLNFSNAGFEGQIPIEIAHLTKLAILDLSTSFTSWNPLKLHKPNIGMLMQNLTEIRELYLDGVMVSAVGEEWCHPLSSLQKLEVLSMSSCNLTGPIGSSLSKLQLLSIMQLSLNNMSSSVPESFANLSSLTTLKLSSCGLTGVFPKDILQIQNLQVLELSHNQDLHGLLPNFPQDGFLQTLNLSYTNFSGQLPSSVSNIKQLSVLDLSSCEFEGTLPSSLSKLNQLVHLDLSFNNFVGPFPFVNMSKSLKYLSFFQNDFTGPISSAHWEGLSNIVSINLGNNAFNGKVPSALFTLPSLQDLTLSRNAFGGLLEEFPNSSLSSLWFLDLSNNKLQGPIPMSLFQLKVIDFLQLSFNQFNGTVRLEMIWRFPNLRTLGISHNNLSVDTTFNDDANLSSIPSKNRLLLGSCNLKEFPTVLRNQSQITTLDLSNNQIEGKIPNWIWRFDYMVHLNLSNNFLTSLEGPIENISYGALMIDLHSNQLGGSIPFFIKNAVLLDYSSNKFSYIPPDIKRYLNFTFFLSLSNNSFHGNIPQSFCNISTLKMLDLSLNSFNGSIPECLTSRSSSLKVLNLEGNKLTGSISDTISSSCELRFFNLNGNLLMGTIPKSLVNCQSLQVLNLGSNQLSDRFPCFLRNVSTLRVLILRSNNLYGPIRCQHSTGNWDMLHIVDLASNKFTSTLPKELLQSWTAMIGDEPQEKYGNLLFDIYGYHYSVRLKDVLERIGKVIATKVLKLQAIVPYKTTESMYIYCVNAYQMQWGGEYLDSVTVVNKGLQMKLVKIPNDLASLDLSSNHFDGPIPEVIMRFKALIVLNMSHNAFSSHIPSSLGNLKKLESLDLSNNSLSGEIPRQIASLSFLSALNLSFNHLVGEIPTGTQIQSFEENSFEGNEGLCGPPLTKDCRADGIRGSPIPLSTERHTSIDWNFLSVELGFIFGLGFIILPPIFWKRWRLWYSKHVDDLLCRIFPQLYFVYENHQHKNYRSTRWRR